MIIYPVNFIWRKVDLVDPTDGTVTRAMAMVPLARYHNVAARQFAEGEEYTLEQSSERSMASHSQYFAALKDYFDNLPEKVAARWPTPDHFRRWLLIETGWFDEKEFNLVSERYAQALAHFVRNEDGYARISIHGTKVIIRKAKSQAVAAMGKEAFQRSKEAVLELAAQIVGVDTKTMMREAGRNA